MMTNLKMMAAVVAMGMMIVSCGNENLAENGQPAGKAHVKLYCSMNVSTRAALTANGRTVTDLYLLDYDKQSGRLLQVLHQTSTATDFAEPDLMLDYGEHTLKVVATCSQAPALYDAEQKAWSIADNVLTPVSATEPVLLTSEKTSDTFAAERDVNVVIGKANAVSITLERLTAKLVVQCTDVFPDECSTITLDWNEPRSLQWKDFRVMDAVKNQRVTDVSSLRGVDGSPITYFVLAPEGGYQTDITFTMGRTDGAPYSTITVPAVPFARNKATTITGSFYNHQQGFRFEVNDKWDEAGTDINI